jgi:predicted RNA-binding Zn ribbon-like protein
MPLTREAPGELELVRAFVNSADFEIGQELFASREMLLSWLVEHGLVSENTVVSKDDLTNAVAFREALRAVLLANNEGVDPEPAVVATLNAVAGRAPVMIRFDATGATELAAGELGVDAALARLLAIIYRAMDVGQWRRLKVCRNEACRWAFYDYSKNRSARWCMMGLCGSRMKARSYRQRKRVGPMGPESTD